MNLVSKEIIRTLCVFSTVLSLVICLLPISSCKKDKENPPPSIDSYSPTDGIEGTVVIIKGSNFSLTLEDNIVKFNGITATVTSATSNTLTVIVPAGASSGEISVVTGGQAAKSADNFTIFGSPVITNVGPNSGFPGTSITITGNNFSTTLTENIIKFNELDAIVTAATSGSLSVTVPDGASTGKISITVHGMTTTSTYDFVVPPTITGFSPSSGIIGSSMTITGTGFNTTASGNTVKFIDKVAVVTAATATSLAVTVPEGAFTGKITVETGGQIATSTTDFIIVPTISGFSPASGAIGSTVIISGTGFSSAVANTVVKFNNISAAVTGVTSTSLTVVVPDGATSGKLTVTIGGNNATSSADYNIETELVKAGGPGYDTGRAVAYDSFGNTYVSGSYQGTANFGNTSINSSGTEDIFLAKYNSDYDLVWVKSVGGTYSDEGYAITVDNSSNVYMTGFFGGTASFGTISLTGDGGYDGFVAKFDPSGDVVWAKQISSGASDFGFSIKLDASGYPHVTGSFSTTATFGPTSLTSDGESDIFVAKYNPANGDLLWAKKYGGINYQSSHSLTINSTGDIYLAGSFFVSANIGTTALTAAGGLDGFIAKLNSTGDVVWAKQISGPAWENALSTALDANENCYVVGYFGGTTDFDGSNLTSSGYEDIFLAKYSPAGSLVWVKSAGSSNNSANARSVATDNSGNAYITGFFSRTATFEDRTLTSNDTYPDVFVAKYNHAGNIVWVKQAGGLSTDNGNSIAVNAAGTITVSGIFRGTGTSIFGATPIIGSGNDDMFLWRIWQ